MTTNRYSVSTVAMPTEPIERALAYIAAAGWPAVDMEYWCKFGLRFDFELASSETRRHFHRRLQAYGITVIGVNAHHSDWGRYHDVAARQFYERSFVWAKQLNARHLTIQVGESVVEETLSGRYLSSINRLQAYAAQYDIPLLVEVPHPGYGCSNVGMLRKLCDMLPRAVGVAIDTGHLSSCGIAVPHALELVGRRLRHVHLKNPTRREIDDIRHLARDHPQVTVCCELEAQKGSPDCPACEVFAEMISVWTHLDRRTNRFFSAGDNAYDGIAAEYNKARSSALQDVDLLRAVAKSYAPAFVLDLGCGCGHAGYAFERHTEILGVDTSAAMLRVAAQSLSSRFVGLPIDLRQFTPCQAAFDMVVAINVLCHFPPSEQREMLQRVLRMTSSGGLVFFVSPVDIPPGNRGTLLGHQMRWYLLSNDEYCHIFRDQGYRTVLHQTVQCSMSASCSRLHNVWCVQKDS